jgi:hypothetical protein
MTLIKSRSSSKKRSLSKSRSLSSSGKRSFTINNAYHIDGCKTKFSHKDYSGRFTKHSAQRAAMNALTELCHVKKIKGQCALYIEMRETTQGSKHKLYGYHCNRVKKNKPLVIPGRSTYNYDMVCKPVRIPSEKCKKSHKSPGPMRSSKGVSKENTTKHTTKHTKKTQKSFLNKLLHL